MIYSVHPVCQAGKIHCKLHIKYFICFYNCRCRNMYISLVSDCEVNKSVKDASFSCVLLNCSFYSPYLKTALFGTFIATAFFKTFLVRSSIYSTPVVGRECFRRLLFNIEVFDSQLKQLAHAYILPLQLLWPLRISPESQSNFSPHLSGSQ